MFRAWTILHDFVNRSAEGDWIQLSETLGASPPDRTARRARVVLFQGMTSGSDRDPRRGRCKQGGCLLTAEKPMGHWFGSEADSFTRPRSAARVRDFPRMASEGWALFLVAALQPGIVRRVMFFVR